MKINQKGSVLLSVVLMLPFLLLIIALYMQLTVSSFRLARIDQSRTYAQFATDAGIDIALDAINQNEAWSGTGSEVQLHNDGTTKTTYNVSVVSNNPDSKTVTAIGRSYRPITSGTPETSVTIKVDLRPVRSGEYSVVSGVGGLIMSNSAKILGGDVLINGKIALTNSAQIGLTTSPVNVEVAHQTCPDPPNATYPRICNSGENGQPISISNSAKIYGNVKANNQTNGASMFNPGLTASSGVAAQPLPPHNRAAQKAAISSSITGASASCSGGTRTWAGNLKITGDVTVSNSCKVTVNGDVWITGKFEVTNSSEVIVSNGLGTTKPVIMVDGDTAKFKNSSTLKSNSSNTGFQIITYKSNSTCSPDCADVTGSELYNSRDVLTIELDNSASGPHTIFYARWTKVLVKNSGQIGALVGQTVELSNSGTITFGTSTGTGTSFWVIDKYRRDF